MIDEVVSSMPHQIWDGALIDRCSVVFYSAPSSYTGEDSVEVFCHGGLSVIKSLTGVFLHLGFREAGPGEFSARAESRLPSV